jgi:hypothetical protein
MLSYLDGTCDLKTAAFIRQRLQNPQSTESCTLREIDALLALGHSDESLAITRRLVEEYLDEIPPVPRPVDRRGITRSCG